MQLNKPTEMLNKKKLKKKMTVIERNVESRGSSLRQGWRTYGTRADFCWHGTFMISLSETSYRALVQSSSSRVTNSS